MSLASLCAAWSAGAVLQRRARRSARSAPAASRGDRAARLPCLARGRAHRPSAPARAASLCAHAAYTHCTDPRGSSTFKHWVHCGLLIRTSDLGFFALIILCFFKKKPLCFLAMRWFPLRFLEILLYSFCFCRCALASVLSQCPQNAGSHPPV